MVVYPNPKGDSKQKHETYGDAAANGGKMRLTINGGRTMGAVTVDAGVHSPRLAWRAQFDLEVDGYCGAASFDPGDPHCGGEGVSFSLGPLPISPPGMGPSMTEPFYGTAGQGYPPPDLATASRGARKDTATAFGSRSHEGAAASGRQIWQRDARAGAHQRQREWRRGPASAVVLRAHGPVQVVVHYSRVGLSVRYGSTWLLRDIPIPGYAPAYNWRFGFGARTTRSDHDAHTVDNLLIQAGNMESGGGSVPVEISANGQQFSSDRLPFVYQPTARPDLVTPDSGPAAGGTNVTITGAHFGHGEAYRCRRYHVVATAADGQTIVCTPLLPAAAGAAAVVNVSISLNATSRRRPSGSTSRGAGDRALLPNGRLRAAARLCSLLTEFLPALKGASEPALPLWRAGDGGGLRRHRCGDGVPHAAADAPSTVSLEVSLNAQQFTTAGQTFVTYSSRACRRSRRRRGRRAVARARRQRRLGLPARTSDFRCRFGTAEVVATYLNDTALAHDGGPARRRLPRRGLAEQPGFHLGVRALRRRAADRRHHQPVVGARRRRHARCPARRQPDGRCRPAASSTRPAPSRSPPPPRAGLSSPKRRRCRLRSAVDVGRVPLAFGPRLAVVRVGGDAQRPAWRRRRRGGATTRRW